MAVARVQPIFSARSAVPPIVFLSLEPESRLPTMTHCYLNMEPLAEQKKSQLHGLELAAA
jgi:hypothetical protein